MRTHNTPRLCAGPQTAGTPIKFWNVASIGDDEGRVWGGHLNRAVISATCELVVTVLDGRTRARSPSTATS